MGHVGRGVRPVAEERGVHTGRAGAAALTHHPHGRCVDVEVPVEEPTRRIDPLGRQLRHLERAVADIAVPKALHQTRDQGQRHPERADRIGHHVAGVRARIDRKAPARRRVGDPSRHVRPLVVSVASKTPPSIAVSGHVRHAALPSGPMQPVIEPPRTQVPVRVTARTQSSDHQQISANQTRSQTESGCPGSAGQGHPERCRSRH